MGSWNQSARENVDHKIPLSFIGQFATILGGITKRKDMAVHETLYEVAPDWWVIRHLRRLRKELPREEDPELRKHMTENISNLEAERARRVRNKTFSLVT